MNGFAMCDSCRRFNTTPQHKNKSIDEWASQCARLSLRFNPLTSMAAGRRSIFRASGRHALDRNMSSYINPEHPRALDGQNFIPFYLATQPCPIDPESAEADALYSYLK